MSSRLLVGVLLTALSFCVLAVEPFKVRDIRVEGIQRTEAGTVFSYLPVKVGDTIDDAKAAAAIKALYATGFFSDVRLEYDGDVLVVQVQERPAIAEVNIEGSKDIGKDQLKEALKQIGLAESRIYDKSLVDKAEKELKRQYLTRGKYAAEIVTTVTPLERNRVGLSFNIKEGDGAKIREINIIGNKVYPEKDLLDLFVLTTPGWFTWYSKNDQYSKQKLAGDLETLRSFYLNRGYLEFAVESTQVSITPDKLGIYITVNVSEGPRYTVTDVKLSGQFIVPEAELRKLVSVKPGDIFSRERVTESSKRIADRLGNEGYSFANINANPDIDKEKHTAAFNFVVDPGRRVYVRRVNISGNSRTKDEVIRREVRQMEGGWYSIEKINRSKERIDRLGFFSEVTVETPAVPGTTDQVDVNFNVVERSTGAITVGAGYSSSDHLVLSAGVSQNNVFGTGNSLSFQVNSGSINKTYSLSFVDPYWTPEGISRGYDLYRRKVNATTLTLAPYETDTYGAGIRFGIPLNETDSVSVGAGYESTRVGLVSNSPIQFINFVNLFGERTSTVRGDLGWSRDSRDSVIYPTKGRLQRAFAELGAPGGDLRYYKLTYQQQYLTPLTSDVTMLLNGDVGYASGYDGRPLPFFKNFYAGGVTSVRGYLTSSLGPQDPQGNSLGGSKKVVGNAELLFPLPGLKNDKSVRMSAFFDAGNVYGQGEKVEFNKLRYSAGVALSWYSPVGPLKLSIGNPIHRQPGDHVERFQFTFGTNF
jgi:outer membrane protein insertion porin family